MRDLVPLTSGPYHPLKLAAAIIMIMLEALFSNLTSVVRALQWVPPAIMPILASRLAPASAK